MVDQSSYLSFGSDPQRVLDILAIVAIVSLPIDLSVNNA